MDPDATLREMRELARRLQDPDYDPANVFDAAADGQRLAELFDALDGWMCKGSALPVQWKAYR